MGKIDKNANLYDAKGKLIAKAPLKSVAKFMPKEWQLTYYAQHFSKYF